VARAKDAAPAFLPIPGVMNRGMSVARGSQYETVGSSYEWSIIDLGG
jgi:hypothetical protein